MTALVNDQIDEGDSRSAEIGVEERGAPKEKGRSSVEDVIEVRTFRRAEHDHAKQMPDLVVERRIGSLHESKRFLYFLLAKDEQCVAASLRLKLAPSIGVKHHAKMFPPLACNNGIEKGHQPIGRGKVCCTRDSIENLCHVTAGVLGELGHEL